MNNMVKVTIIVSFLIFIKVSMLTIPINLVIAQERPSISVALQVTSGVKNPGWVFDDPEDLDQLRSFISNLSETASVVPPPFGGFLLSTSDESMTQFPESVLVFAGVIKTRTADGTISFFQDTKGLETFLRAEAEERGLGRFPMHK